MNERIFEIIQELNGRVGLHWDDEDKEELAELIIQECAKVAAKVDNTPSLEPIDKLIQSHFSLK